jgi:hypothetical protein
MRLLTTAMSGSTAGGKPGRRISSRLSTMALVAMMSEVLNQFQASTPENKKGV